MATDPNAGRGRDAERPSEIPRAGWRDPEIRRMVWLAFTSSGYTGLYNLVSFAILVVAGATFWWLKKVDEA